MTTLKKLLTGAKEVLIGIMLTVIMILNLLVAADAVINGWYDDSVIPMIIILVAAVILKLRTPTIIIKNEKGDDKK